MQTRSAPTHIVTTYHRKGPERTPCVLIEILTPASEFDTDTHRVQFACGGIIRVSPDQLKPI